MYKKLVVFGLLSLAILALVSCNNKDETTNEKEPINHEKLELYTTIFPLEDFAKKIGGQYVTVTNLIPVGADSHTFEPTAKDLINVASSDAFIYNGAGLEGFVDTLLETLKKEKIKIVKASENIELIELTEEHGHEHGEEEYDQDPHVWLDPILAITLAESIKDALIELKPEEELYFTENFERLEQSLHELDEKMRSVVEGAERDTIFVSHAGYGYWETRYGVKQEGITGISPTNEPTQRRLQTIIEYAKENDVKYILFEQNIPTKIAEVVKNAVNAEAITIHNLEAILEEDVQNDEDYISLMEKNIEALKIVLND